MYRSTPAFRLLAGAAAVAMGLGLTATSGQAFDEVNWTWDAHIDEVITKTVSIDIDIDADSLTMIELVQSHAGDVTASSAVTDIERVQPDGIAPIDPVAELALVVSEAVAVGNNANIASVDDVLQLHVIQSVLDDGETPADISADSTVTDILNASVESTATAVGNNLNVEFSADGPESAILGDFVQMSYANVSAASHVSNVALNNYQNLGTVDPIVHSVATAVGNNANISVNLQ